MVATEKNVRLLEDSEFTDWKCFSQMLYEKTKIFVRFAASRSRNRLQAIAAT